MENRSLSRPLASHLPPPQSPAIPWRLWLGRLQIILMLVPALAIIGSLFIGGLVLALVQSFGYLPLIGRNELSLVAYRHIFGQEAFYRSLWLTGWIALTSTVLSTILAILCALMLRRIARRQRWLSFLFQLNIPIPHLVGAIGILFLFSQSGWLARLAYLAQLINEPADFPALVFDPYAFGIILEYVWKETCFIGVILLAVLQALGEDYEDVARTLGARPLQVFIYVTWPAIWPGVLAGSLFAFVISWSQYVLTLIIGGGQVITLPILLFAFANSGDNPITAALSLVFIAPALLFLMITARYLTGRNAALGGLGKL